MNDPNDVWGHSHNARKTFGPDGHGVVSILGNATPLSYFCVSPERIFQVFT